ncbi:hypothetical protein MJ560_02080 [Klebsiella pneumoniae]|nr:hypothetical protein MJ560_02080 [Klebsiella pneumoniae]
MLVIFSKNRITEETLAKLQDLARKRLTWRALSSRCSQVRRSNRTDDQKVAQHVALRNRSNTPIVVDGKDAMPEVNAVLGEDENLLRKRLSPVAGKGYTGKPITDVVNIGIECSDLGPFMVTGGAASV